MISLSDETNFTREGMLDFIDNALDRSSGIIHARATVPNPDLFLAPGQFARLRVAIAQPTPVYLLPDAAVVQARIRANWRSEERGCSSGGRPPSEYSGIKP
jgi:membrane fusion protein, multidrug efflux system